MPPRRRRPDPLPRLSAEAEAGMADLSRLFQAGHIPKDGLKAFLQGKSIQDIHAEAERLCGKAPPPAPRRAARPKRAAVPSGSWEIEASVRHIKPRIWRRFTLSTTETFLDLHEAIQDAGGWYNAHLFAFTDARTGEPLAGLPSPDDTVDMGPFAGDVRLADVIPASGKAKFLYHYDFGDNWEVDVAVRAFLPDPAPWQRCLVAGARAFPPDDAGGEPGYEDCVEALAAENPTEYQKERREWLGLWTPEKFDLEEEKGLFDRKKRKRTGNYEEEL